MFLLSGYTIVSVLPRLNYCFVLSISFNIYQTFQSFHQFRQAQEQRAENLDDLKSMFKNNAFDDGVYVLVIGESTTRDRMHAYGYERENTPWLSAMVQSPSTLLFSNAYSNHTHTVPALEYALTGLNQYQHISTQKAFSLPEIANAAGFETYWLSNQKQFPSSVIPIATIASATKHQTWLNYLGDKRESSGYYDEKLVDFIPWQNIPSKVLIFVHLMGCHLAYNERYPSEFSFFKGADQDQNEYDNAVLYNDYVLGKLYDKVKNLPNFQAFIYFSDHGEELKNKARHDASKFTFTMTHIPLVMIFSDEFMRQRPEIFKTLQRHTTSYFTNDLVYNFILGILGIQGLPNQNESLDIASAQYRMTKDDLLTLHGQKRIADEQTY